MTLNDRFCADRLTASRNGPRARALAAALAFAIGSASLASAQDDLSRRSATGRPPTAMTEDKSAAEAPFLRENDAAMMKMINGMDVKPTGNIDRDFVAMMVPHHQGAIDMAEAELSYGHNEQLLRIAQGIVVEELQEIAAMRGALGEKLTPSEARLAASAAGAGDGLGSSPSGPADDVPPDLKGERPFLAENDAAMTKMMAGMTIMPTGDIDRDFVAMMVPHHQGAIDMAQAELRYGHEAQLRRVAQEIIVDQIQEISLMRLALGDPLPPSVSSPTDPAILPQPAPGPTTRQDPVKMEGMMEMLPTPSKP